jgi:hypothetical protein
MYALEFKQGEHKTFVCLACGKKFTSKPAIQQHFRRQPTHAESTITRSDIASQTPDQSESAGSRGERRRRFIHSLQRDTDS